jgi:hypothetical protein
MGSWTLLIAGEPLPVSSKVLSVVVVVLSVSPAGGKRLAH